MRASTDRMGMLLTVTLPFFTLENNPCRLVNGTSERIAQALTDYFKTVFGGQLAIAHGTRFPVTVVVEPKIHRMDAILLSFELQVSATLRRQTVYDKHVYLHFANNATLPLSARALTGKRLACVLVQGEIATDPQTGKCYPIKQQYRPLKE